MVYEKGLSRTAVRDQVARAFQSSNNDSANKNKRVKETGVPLVTTYTLQYHYADQEVKKVFTPAPFVSFRSARNLKGFLVRSNVFTQKSFAAEAYTSRELEDYEHIHWRDHFLIT